ncbi:uncharacterized protein [Haliotis asinina]|uniref:uncharacterized protein n=1 Tax=Haliotis asinina TaxID=109174 RepID=UPI00353234FA
MCRNRVTSLLKQAKQLHIRQKVTESKGDSKQLFSIVNSLTDTKGSSTTSRSEQETFERAEALCDFFIEKLYLSIKPASLCTGVSRLERCITEIQEWMLCYSLKLNGDKTDFIVIGTKQQLSKLPSINLEVNKVTIEPSAQVKNLGVIFDHLTSSKKQSLNIARSANYHLANIGRICKYIDSDTTKTLINSFVTSRLDYCNALLSGTTVVSNLQRIQNKAARVISLTKPTDHITPVIKQLHWLPVQQRIIFKQLLSTLHSLSRPLPAI